VLLLGIEPEQSTALKREPAPAQHISDRSPDHQVQLQLNVVVAFEFRRMPSGLHKVEEAVVTRAEF
jgi:hypothetical protein